MKKDNNNPPKSGLWLLARFAGKGIKEGIISDFCDIFKDKVQEEGRRRAVGW